jgi:RND family efflux transporter MFP subunit
VQRELTNYAEFNGWLQADRKQEVRARVRGHIKKIGFNDGDRVTKGQMLFEIDPRPFEAEIAVAKAQVNSADAQLTLATREVARIGPLVTTGAASQQEYDVWLAKQKVAVAEKARAETEVKRAQLNLEYSKITADQNGRIGQAELTEGNLVNAGGSDPLLTTIVSITPIRVAFNLDERSLQFYARGVKAAGKNVSEMLANIKDQKIDFKFELEGETGFPHTARLAYGGNEIDPKTGTVELYGLVDNENEFFQPGSRVRVRLPIGKPSPALLVPDTAILADQDKRYVLIADEKNVVRRRNVTLGVLTDDKMRAIQPADKLQEGENPENWWVLVDNLQRARLNDPIDPQKPGQSAPAAK